jgi:hypothetical protein
MGRDLPGEIQQVIQRLAALPSEYWKEAFPCSYDEEVAQAVAFYKQLNSSWRVLFVASTKSEVVQGQLRIFAERMAILGVRAQNPELIKDGLVALLMTGFLVDQYQPLALALAQMNHSMVKLNMDIPATVAEVMGYAVNVVGAHPLQDFFNRPSQGRSLQSMGYQEFQTPRGVVYWNGDADTIPEKWR